MNRIFKFLVSTLLALALLLAAAAGALAWWLSGDGPRAQVQALASERLGVPVTLGKLSLSVLPWPEVVVDDLMMATQPPVKAQQVQLRPAWRKLFSEPRELEIRLLSLKGLSLPQQGLDQLSQSLSKSERSAQNIQGLPAQKTSKNTSVSTAAQDSPAVRVGLLAIPQHTQLEDVVWYSKAGQPLALSGDVRMSATRGEAQVDLKLGGGTVRGPLRLARKTSDGKAPWQLRGELKTQGVDLAALPGVGARLAGRLEATTTLEAQAAQMDGIGTALQTRTQFSVGGAVIKGVDLVKAVTTLGLSRGGETALQQLSGNLATRGAGAPMQISLSDLEAQSKLLKASGGVNVGAAASVGGPRALSGKVNVDLLGGEGVGKAVGALVGIPLEISGTTAAPEVRPTRGAMIGGVIGSVMAPVIGTGAGAKLGDKAAQKLGSWKDKLFGK